MVQAVSRDAYREQIHALLPAGRAWPEESDTTLDALVRAIAAQVAEIDLSDANLLNEIRPDTTFDLLPEWERVAGLPDVCSVLGSTIAERRASLLEKIVTKLTLNAAEFVRIGESFGVTITVEELDQARADAISGLDTSNGKWRFVWWIGIPTNADVRRFNTLSDVNTPLLDIERNTEMECRLQNAAPAHTYLIIGYESILTGLRFELPVHSEFANDRLRWQNFTDGLGDVSSLLATAGTEALSRLQIDGDGADTSNDCQLRTLGGAEMSPAFEGYASAITVQVEGLEDLVMAGPSSALHDSSDATEPYQFVPGDDYTNGAITYTYSANDQPAGLAAWVEDFKAAYAADNSIRAVLTLYDGV